MTADLAAVEQQKASLEQALQQSRQLPTPGLQPPGPVERNLEAEVKQLQMRLKVSGQHSVSGGSACPPTLTHARITP